MADTLYRSHSLEKASNNGDVVTSGTLITWEDRPVSSLDVGDTFQPVPNGPILTVKKVSINDSVIGTVAGKAVRQWQISVEGDNEAETSSSDTSLLDKHNFSIEQDDDNVIHSGSVSVVSVGENPPANLTVGSLINIPGIGKVQCTKITGSDDFDDNGSRGWTITYEGSDAPNVEDEQQDSLIPETKYNLAIEKDSDGLIQKSGSKVVVTEGSSPTFDIQVGSTFNIPGIGNVTCSKVSGSDDYTDSGAHRWTMTYEGYINDDDSGEEQQSSGSQDTQYKFSTESDNSGGLSHSGSIEITTISDTPPSTYQVGSSLNIPGIGEVTCVKVSGSDSYTDNGRRKWTIIYEGADSSSATAQDTRYSFDIETNSDGITVYSGSKEISYSGDTPTPGINVGETFSIPVIGSLTCSKIRGSDEGAGSWTFVIEGSRTNSDTSGEQFSLPDEEISVSYELNGTTARTIDGDFIALRRSNTPIKKTTITEYSASQEALAVIGDNYKSFGLALSENIIKEVVKKDNVIISTYYKHTIEVEA